MRKLTALFSPLVRFLLLASLTFGLITCAQGTSTVESDGNAPAPAAETVADGGNSPLTIWWTQGFLPEENEVVVQLVEAWKAASGYEANLVLLPDRDIVQDTQQAIAEERGPDVLFSFAADTNLFPRLAWEGKLADLSEVIEPIKETIAPTALESVYYQNKETQKRSYYALPFAQNTVHLHYWDSLLASTGLSRANIPTQWENFWQFWQMPHNRLREQGKDGVYGVGLCLSALGTDTFWAFEQFLDAYNIEIVSPDGTLQLGREARAGLAAVIGQFASFYQQGYVPPDAVEWTDSGNNISFLEQQSLMTANSTLSVPFTQRHPDNPYNRHSKDYYFNQIKTLPWPNNLDGSPHRSVLSIKQLAVLQSTQNLEAAKSFVAFFNQPANLDRFLRQAQKGRIFPVIPALWQDPFWNDPADPHVSVALQQYQQNTRASYQVYAPAYSEVLQENVWAKAVLRVIQNGISPEQAADEAIAQVKQIFEGWA
jgi:multiple sugar transport system substrate-binding protein